MTHTHMTLRHARRWLSTATLMALTAASQAALINQGDGTVKDTNTNLVWLQDWNVNGLTNWGAQNSWANTTLDGFAGSDDWRLPEIGEYAALFAAYGDLRRVPAFTNVQSGSYWSGTEVLKGSLSWFFIPGFGGQTRLSQNISLFAVAVRPGDVTGSVPEPQTLTLALLALLALGATLVARRRPR